MSDLYNITIPDYIKDNEILTAIQGGLEECTWRTPLMNDWSVAQANQPSIQALQDKMVYWDVISRRRLGVQGELLSGGWQGTNWKRTPVWHEIWLIQVSAFMMRTEREFPLASTFNSQDAIVNLQAYVNDPFRGLSYWFKSFADVPDMQVVRSTDIRNIDFETDSGLKQKFPQFDFEIVMRRVPSRDAIGINRTDIVEGQTKPV